MEIEIEIGIEMFIRVQDVASNLESQFIGMRKDEFLIITPPAPFVPVKQKFVPGVAMVAKYMHQGKYYLFQTHLIELLTKPVRICIVTYPNIVRDSNLRSSKRIISCIPVALEDHLMEKTVGIIRDVSSTGCCCQVQTNDIVRSRFFRKDDPVTLRCRFPGYEGEMEIKGKVMNVKKVKQESTVGIAFFDVSAPIKKVLNDYILSVEPFS